MLLTRREHQIRGRLNDNASYVHSYMRVGPVWGSKRVRELRLISSVSLLSAQTDNPYKIMARRGLLTAVCDLSVTWAPPLCGTPAS